MNRKVVKLESGNCYLQLPLSLWGKPLLSYVVSNVAEDRLKVPGPQKSQLSFVLTTLFRLDQNPVIHLCIFNTVKLQNEINKYKHIEGKI